MRSCLASSSLALVVLAASVSAQQERLSIAIFDAPGVGAEALDSAVAALAEHAPRRVTPANVRAGALDRARVVLFTGGRGSVQGRLLGEDGRERVRRFVREGGGYVGICAGAYLAIQGPPEFYKVGIVAAHSATGDRWRRGIAPARVAPADGSAGFELHYANGPLLEAEPVDGLAPFVTLASFETDLHWARYDTHPGEMRGRPAIAVASYGRGRIVLFSPNPTLEPARPELLRAAIRWASEGGTVAPNVRFRDVFPSPPEP